MCVTQMIRLWSNENGLQVCTRCAPKGQINPAQGNALGRIDIAFPRVPLRLGGVALPWAELICPFGAHSISPIVREILMG